MSGAVADVAIAVVAAVLAITLHEAAHGFAAMALGDNTARSLGRLSLNPLRHVDRFGTIVLPGLLLLSQLATLGRVAFMFGWAKPVPVNPLNFRFPRQGMALVAAAGPAMNVLLAWLAALTLHVTEAGGLAEQFTDMFIITNLVLALFNLLPIPPLDGGRIVVGILPRAAAAQWARLEKAGLLVVVLGVFLLPQLLKELGYAFDPVGSALNRILPQAFDLVLRLAGIDG